MANELHCKPSFIRNSIIPKNGVAVHKGFVHLIFLQRK